MLKWWTGILWQKALVTYTGYYPGICQNTSRGGGGGKLVGKFPYTSLERYQRTNLLGNDRYNTKKHYTRHLSQSSVYSGRFQLRVWVFTPNFATFLDALQAYPAPQHWNTQQPFASSLLRNDNSVPSFNYTYNKQLLKFNHLNKVNKI
jgi:hypothetical protein